MRIAFIHPSSPSAEGTGATHSATQIVTGLSEAGHDIDVYCTTEPYSDEVSSSFDLYHLDGESRHPHTNTKLNREIQSRLGEFQKYDVVHSYMTPLIPSVAELGNKLGLNTVVTLNAYGGVCAKNDLLYLNKEQCVSKSTTKCLNCIAGTGFLTNENGYLYQTASQLLSLRLINTGESKNQYIDAYQALSKHVKEKYVNFGFDGDDIRVIPNILDDQFLVDHKSDFSEPYRLLYVGTLREHKGVGRLPAVISRLQDFSKFDFELTIVGEGDLKSTLMQDFDEQNLSSLVSFKGHMPYESLPEVYANHDVFVYPGIWDEPFGRVFIEALAAGTPVIATDVGAAQEIIGDAGVTVDPDPETIAKTIHSTIAHDRIHKLRNNTRDQLQRYESDEIIKDFIKLYQIIQ